MMNFEEIGTRMKQIRLGGARVMADFYTRCTGIFKVDFVERELHKVRRCGRCTCFGFLSFETEKELLL